VNKKLGAMSPRKGLQASVRLKSDSALRFMKNISDATSPQQI